MTTPEITPRTAEYGRDYKRQVAWLRPLLREARDLLYHNSFCGIGNSDGCCGCKLEERIDLYFDRFEEHSDGSEGGHET